MGIGPICGQAQGPAPTSRNIPHPCCMGRHRGLPLRPETHHTLVVWAGTGACPCGVPARVVCLPVCCVCPKQKYPERLIQHNNTGAIGGSWCAGGYSCRLMTPIIAGSACHHPLNPPDPCVRAGSALLLCGGGARTSGRAGSRACRATWSGSRARGHSLRRGAART